MVDNRSIHYFFKVLIDNFSQKLMIPAAFLKYVPAGTRDYCLLENSRGRAWKVDVTRNEDGEVYLSGRGWTDFVKDSRLHSSEFLLFGYDGKTMHVDIFGTSACERDPGDMPRSEEKTKEKPARTRKERAATGPERGGGVNRSRRRTCQEAKQRSESASKFTSDHPHFSTTLRNRNIHQHLLEIPRAFARNHLPHRNTKLVLRDQEGRAWVVKFSAHSRNVSAGWMAFVRGNNLQSGDFCIFELVGRTELQFHLFRNKH